MLYNYLLTIAHLILSWLSILQSFERIGSKTDLSHAHFIIMANLFFISRMFYSEGEDSEKLTNTQKYIVRKRLQEASQKLELTPELAEEI